MDQLKKFSPAVYAIIIFCFFLPFVNITCGGQTVMSLTGIQLITGAEYKPQDMFGQQGMSDDPSGQQDMKINADQNIDPQPMALFALIFAIVGLGLSFIRKKVFAILCLIVSVLGAVCILLLKASLDGDASMQGQGMGQAVVQVEYQFGYWFSFLLFVAGAVLQWFNFKDEGNAVAISGLPTA